MENPNGNGSRPPEPESRIIIKFDFPGAAVASEIRSENVAPMQFFTLAARLEKRDYPPPEKSLSLESVLVVHFERIGSARCALEFVGTVEVCQLDALARWLDWMARKQFDMINTQQQPQRAIAVPKLAIPPLRM